MSNFLSLNRFFSKTTFNMVLCGECSSFYNAIKNEYANDNKCLNRDIVSSAYSTLNRFYRNEYFYKNTLFYELIFLKHKINSTKVYSELNIGKCIADFVTINGKAIVYEIKTEFDTLDRIEQQVNQYYECFPYVVIVTCLKHLDKVMEMYSKSSVGIYLITESRKIRSIKEPEANFEMLNKKTIFNILRKNEYETILRMNKKELPKTTQVKYYSECLKLFCELDCDIILKNVLSVLKKRFKTINKLFFQVPDELKMLVYQSNYNNDDYNRLFEFLESDSISIKEAKRNVFSLSTR